MKQKAPLQQPPQSKSEQTSTSVDNESTSSEHVRTNATLNESAYNTATGNKPAFSGPSVMGRSPEEMVQMMGADAFVHMTTAPDVYEGWMKERGLDKDPVYRERHEIRMRMMYPERYKAKKSESVNRQEESGEDDVTREEEQEESADLKRAESTSGADDDEIQEASLRVSSPTDQSEHEAEQMSDRVMTMNEPGQVLHKSDMLSLLQSQNRQYKTVNPAVTNRINQQRGTGISLPESTQNFMENRMDADFSGVKIHNNSESFSLSKTLNAKAFTVGNDVFFGQGQYAPETHAGKKLIAHELTHTMQNGSVQRNVIQRRSNPYWEQGSQNRESEPVEENEAKEKPGFFSRMSINGLIKLIRKIPDSVFGSFSIAGLIFKYGAIGFLQRLAKEGGRRLKLIVKNAFKAFTSWEYFKGYLLGLVKGFFVEGAWGTIKFLWEIIKLPYTLFKFGKKVVQFLGDVDLGKSLKGFGNWMVSVGQWIGKNGKKIVQEIFSGGASFDLKKVGAFLQNLAASAKSGIQKVGGKFADVLLRFFGQPVKALGKKLGTTMGTIVGTILFAVFTMGGGAAVTAAKGVVKTVVGWIVKVGSKIIKVARAVVGKVWSWLKTAGKGIVSFVSKISKTLGGKFGELVEAIKGFVGRLWKRIGQGRKTPKPKKGRKPKYRPDAGRKSKELKPALALAKSIAEVHDKKGSSVFTVLAFLNALLFRFGWIKAFRADPKGAGHYKLVMLASEHEVDKDYTPGDGGAANVVKVNKPDPAADALAKKIGGESTVKFPDIPNEFDVINLEKKIIGQTTGRTILGSSFRTQARVTFETAQKKGMSVIYEFTKKPHIDLIKKLSQYAKEYNVKLKIIHNY